MMNMFLRRLGKCLVQKRSLTVIIWFVVVISITTTIVIEKNVRSKLKVKEELLKSFEDFGTIQNGNIGILINLKRIKREKMKAEQEKEDDYKKRTQDLCPLYSNDLEGALDVDSAKNVPLEEAIANSGDMTINGCYVPKKCYSRQKLAVVIPYKDRYEHLLTLVNHLHRILQRQNLLYCIFVAEQYDNRSFNKAQIMNAAFEEITSNYKTYGHPLDLDHQKTLQPFDCFVFHDVDMLMENDHNLYMCQENPVHLSPAIDKFNYSTFYGTKFGGVTAIRSETYRKVNGHSNQFWGWGGEDNDMEQRLLPNDLNFTKKSIKIKQGCSSTTRWP